MADFSDEPVGTAAIVFEDGSAIVRGDGSEGELLELRRLVSEHGLDGEDADAFAAYIQAQGLAFAKPGSDYRIVEGKTKSGATFNAMAHYLTSVN